MKEWRENVTEDGVNKEESSLFCLCAQKKRGDSDQPTKESTDKQNQHHNKRAKRARDGRIRVVVKRIDQQQQQWFVVEHLSKQQNTGKEGGEGGGRGVDGV
jgi:hypothetical protein